MVPHGNSRKLDFWSQSTQARSRHGDKSRCMLKMLLDLCDLPMSVLGLFASHCGVLVHVLILEFASRSKGGSKLRISFERVEK